MFLVHWVYVGIQDQRVLDWILIVEPFLAAIACFLAARSHQGDQRSAWKFLGGANLAWAAGQGIWTFYELVLGITNPFPGWADAGYLIHIPLAGAAILYLSRGPKRAGSRVPFLLDSAILLAALVFLSWALAIGAVVEAGTFDPTIPFDARLITALYPIGNVILITLLLARLSGPAAGRRLPFVLVALGLAAFFLADMAYAYLTSQGTYHIGHPIDLLWGGGFLLTGIAAVHARAAPGTAETPPRRLRTRGVPVPYYPLLVAVLVAVFVEFRQGGLEPFLFWNVMLLVSFVVLRQLFSLAENRRLTDAVESAYEQLKEADAFRTQLLQNVSHDLKNPLTPIKLQLRILEDKRKAGEGPIPEHSMEILQRNVQVLERLVADTTDLSQLETGQLKLYKAPLDATDVARTTLASLKEVAAGRGLAFEGEFDGALPVLGDRERIAQVLLNLSMNAFKFTPGGGRVTIGAKAAGPDVHLWVRDSGRGLTGEEMARLFRPFSQVHKPGEIKEKGSGLGLYISKGILEAHGGRIWVESEGPGKGSVFKCSIPMAAATPAGAAS